MTEDVIEEYPHDYRIIAGTDESGEREYHFEGPLGRIKSFYSEDKARLYADVHEVVDGFREEKTGERGAPPAVAQAGENVQVAYYVSMPTMSVEWAAGQYGLSEDEVLDVVGLIRGRAAEKRRENNDD